MCGPRTARQYTGENQRDVHDTLGTAEHVVLLACYEYDFLSIYSDVRRTPPSDNTPKNHLTLIHTQTEKVVVHNVDPRQTNRTSCRAERRAVLKTNRRILNSNPSPSSCLFVLRKWGLDVYATCLLRMLRVVGNLILESEQIFVSSTTLI